MPPLFKPIVHRGEQISKMVVGGNTAWRLAAGGPKQVIGHPFGGYLGFDDRDAGSGSMRGVHTDGEPCTWPVDAVPHFFDKYADGREVTEDAFHQALTWLVTP